MIVMARFCGNCGAQLDDDARVCGQCGTPIDGEQGKIPGLKITDPEKKKKLVKRIKTAVVLLVVAIVAIVGVRVALSYTGTNGLVRKVMAAYEKNDVDALVALSSDILFYCSDDYENDVYEYYEYAFDNNIDSFESSVGHSYKMTYKVEAIYDLSQRKQHEMLKDVESSCPDFDEDLISKISVARVKITAKQGSKSVSKTVKIFMAKEGNNWKLLYIE